MSEYQNTTSDVSSDSDDWVINATGQWTFADYHPWALWYRRNSLKKIVGWISGFLGLYLLPVFFFLPDWFWATALIALVGIFAIAWKAFAPRRSMYLKAFESDPGPDRWEFRNSELISHYPNRKQTVEYSDIEKIVIGERWFDLRNAAGGLMLTVPKTVFQNEPEHDWVVEKISEYIANSTAKSISSNSDDDPNSISVSGSYSQFEVGKLISASKQLDPNIRLEGMHPAVLPFAILWAGAIFYAGVLCNRPVSPIVIFFCLLGLWYLTIERRLKLRSMAQKMAANFADTTWSVHPQGISIKVQSKDASCTASWKSLEQFENVEEGLLFLVDWDDKDEKDFILIPSAAFPTAQAKEKCLQLVSRFGKPNQLLEHAGPQPA